MMSKQKIYDSYTHKAPGRSAPNPAKVARGGHAHMGPNPNTHMYVNIWKSRQIRWHVTPPLHANTYVKI